MSVFKWGAHNVCKQYEPLYIHNRVALSVPVEHPAARYTEPPFPQITLVAVLVRCKHDLLLSCGLSRTQESMSSRQPNGHTGPG